MTQYALNRNIKCVFKSVMLNIIMFVEPDSSLCELFVK